MVIAVLVNRFAPSSRGLRRAETLDYFYDGDDGVMSNSSGGRRQQQRQNRFYRSNRRIGMSARKIQSSISPSSTSHWAKIRNITQATSAFSRLYPKVVLQDDDDDNDTSTINAKDGIMKTTTYDDRYYALTNPNSSRQSQTQLQQQQPHAPSSSSSSLQGRQQQQKQSSFSSYYSSIRNMGNGAETNPAPPQVAIGNTTHRRKPFKAITFVTSFASDMDVIADWIFYRCATNADQKYRNQWIEQYGDNDNNVDSSDPSIPLPYMAPPILLRLALISCILGTIMWLVLATDGRVAAPLCRLWGIDRLSMGMVLFVCVLVEDIPQIILTFVIEEYYEEGRSLSTFAVTNVIISVYDILIKLAEAYDDRHDVVETGVWCKVSIPNAHNDTITALALLAPHHVTSDTGSLVPTTDDVNTSPKSTSYNSHIIQPNNEASNTTSTEPVAPMSNHDNNTSALTTDYTNMSSIEQLTIPSSAVRNQSSNSSSTEATKQALNSSQVAKIHSQSRMRFLTVSKDKKIRLWESDHATVQRSTTNLLSCSNDTTVPNDNEENDMNHTLYNRNSSFFIRRNKCLKVFKGHQYAITCITILGTIVHDDIHRPPQVPEQDEQSQSTSNSDYNRIPSPKSTTATGSPTPRAIPKFGFGQPSTQQQQQQHCTYFLTGCQNGTIKLWNMNATKSGSIREYLSLEGNAKNSTSAITSLVVLMEGITFLAGYANGTVRLWDAWTGTCIALYDGHHGSSNTRTICCTLQDDTSFISGSSDARIHLWDTTSAMNAYHLRLQQQHHNENDEDSVHNVEEGGVGSSVFPKRIGRPHSPNMLQQLQQQQQQHPLRKVLFSEKKFQGHTDGITSLCCLEPGLAFLSGSRDGTVRLWSVQTGMCLRVFSTNASTPTGGITVVRAIDHVTFLTGSNDATIRLWDALTGNIIRIYTGHTKPITDLTVTDDDSTFITTSVDRSIKVWVVSAVNSGSSNSILEPNNQHPYHANEEEKDDPMFVNLCNGAAEPY